MGISFKKTLSNDENADVKKEPKYEKDGNNNLKVPPFHMENVVYALIGNFHTADGLGTGSELIGIFKTERGAQKMAKWIGEHDEPDLPYHYSKFEIRGNIVLD